MAARLLRLPFAVLALTLSACGGTDEGRPDDTRAESVPVDQCELARAYEFQNIANFDPMPGEMPESTLSEDCDSATPCDFNYNYDSANTPPASPPADCPDVEAFADPRLNEFQLLGSPVGTRCDEAEYATRIVARNLAVCTNAQGRQGWGGSLSVTFGSSIATAFDASEYDGFSFWVKKASSATRSALIAAAADTYTAGIENIPSPSGGPAQSCDSSGLTNDAITGEPILDTEKCDGFGVSATLSDDWTFIPIRFAAMRQKGFGMPIPAGHIDSAKLIRLQFLISAGDWDIWIDDIAFFRDPEP